MTSLITSMLEKFPKVNQQQISTQEQANQSKFPFESPVTECYIESSEFYRIRGGFIAEVIQNPFVKFIDKGMTERVIQDLRKVTLAAFGKTEAQAEVYASDEVMRKNAILVDWLTVVRKGTRIVAYTTGSIIERDVFYTNATMVIPEYQRNSGLGIVPNIYIWNKLLGKRMHLVSGDIKLVCRTQNKSIVSLLTHIWEEMIISGENNISDENKQMFKKIAESTNSSYEENNGISRNVYPGNLPKGKDNGHTNRFKEMFEKLGVRDAFYVAGKANARKFKKVIKMQISAIYEKAKSDFGYRNEIPLEAVA